MTILYFISSLHFGGAEKQAVMDSNLLSTYNTVYLVTFFEGPQLKLISDKVNYIKINKSGYLKTARILAELCKEKRVEIIHASLFAACTISAISSLISKVAVIWLFHSHEYDLPLRSRLAIRLLANFLYDLLKDPDMLRRYSENIATGVHAGYPSWEELAESIMKIYTD